MKLMPEDIEDQQFKIRFRGFDRYEVNRFLDQMAQVVANLQTTVKRQEDALQRLQRDIQGYQQREEIAKSAMANARQSIDQVKENAQKSAEIIVADAEVKAEKILNRAHGRLSQLHEDIAELKRQRIQIEVQIRATLDAHTKLLEAGKENMDARDAEDAKIRLLNQSRG
ncbi:DivIVA domain-containing protein [Desulfosarcina sp. OttesenSCG-928-A07]|nr:DivIVA domain-containing protein [Desulfosarcina sp. OttesenSCG-928-G17]MDL2328307.1 DivIVA domain-containing protein [Desulfosarcina sp. OttesenSCG-928-A07]